VPQGLLASGGLTGSKGPRRRASLGVGLPQTDKDSDCGRILAEGARTPVPSASAMARLAITEIDGES
jgi:hypothetical protein